VIQLILASNSFTVNLQKLLMQIAEINMDNIRFFKEHKDKDFSGDVHFTARVENSKVFLRFLIIINDKRFDYTINPSDESGREFCNTGKVTINDPKLNKLAVITLDKNKVIAILSQIPIDYFEK